MVSTYFAKSSFNRILFFYSFVQSILLLAFLCLSVLVNLGQKNSIGGFAAASLRSSLVLGDMRAAANELTHLVRTQFIGAQYVSSKTQRLELGVPASFALEKHGANWRQGLVTVPIYYASDSKELLGELVLVYDRFEYAWASFLLWALSLVLFFPVLWRERNSLASKIEKDKKYAQAEAIARTTQSLAHDVRKPFSMIQMIADAVDNTQDPVEAKEIMTASIPEINQAIASVDGMLSDILEIGGNSKPVIEVASPETLFEATLNQIFRVYPESNVKVSYEFNHSHMVAVDTTKVLRVFANIVGNAVQAMDQKGNLWFCTREVIQEGQRFIEFCLGNGGSFIPAESLTKLFDAFFTSGKKGGTGLGLAIAQKIVKAHGGVIWCESHADGGKQKAKGGCVEFYFTLPASDLKTTPRTGPMPVSSDEITQSFAKLREASQGKVKIESTALDASVEKEIINLVSKLATSQLTSKPILLFVDDEALYRNSLARLVNQSAELAKCFDVQLVASVKEELEFVAIKTPLAVVQDIDLGFGQLNGYDAMKTLRNRGFKGAISVHSNRASAEDCKTASEAGADAILPKPMSRSHLLNFLLAAVKNHQISNKQNEPAQAETNLPEFAVVDDSRAVTISWRMKSKGTAVVHTFDGPKSFFAAVEVDQMFLGRLEFIVTDFHFAEGVIESGLGFGARVKKVFDKPILLSSNSDFSSEEVQGCVDKVIAKTALEYSSIKKLIC